MHLLILGMLLLVAASSARAHAVAYPQRSALLAYSPARGEFPIAQGYIRYYDGAGAERLIGYNYPEPLQGTRRLSYDNEAVEYKRNPLLRTSIEQLQQQESNDLLKAREEHFRAWCEQRYQALKTEIDKLRAEGKQPSYDLMAQIKPLEKIMATIETVETPEIKDARQEHLRIWNEARLKVAQRENEQLKLQGIYRNPIETNPEALRAGQETISIIEETAEQKKARDEHLRSYQSQLLLIQQLEAKRLELLRSFKDQPEKQSEPITNERLYETSLQPTSADLSAPLSVQETPEVLRAREEHLRLFNEANNKLKAPESISYNYESSLKIAPQPEEKELKPSDQQLSVRDTPEVVRAREEHLKLVQEAQLRTQAEGSQYLKQDDDDGLYKPSQEGAYIPTAQLKTFPGIRQPEKTSSDNLANDLIAPKQIEDTPEVKRAREDHLRLVDEANLKAAQYQPEIEAIRNDKITTYIAIKEDDEKVRETEYIKQDELLSEIERLREGERLREEEKRRETERLRLLEEERLREVEFLRLKKEDQQRMDMERFTEMKMLREDENLNELYEKNQPISGQLKAEIQATLSPSAYILREQYKQNPYLVRLSAQQNSYYIDNNNESPNPEFPRVVYYPSASTTNLINPENPFLIRYQQSRPELFKDYLETPTQRLPERFYHKSELKPIAADKTPIAAYISPSAGMKIDYGAGTGLYELEKATREHFRAHELALEQLRLANLKQPYTKEC